MLCPLRGPKPSRGPCTLGDPNLQPETQSPKTPRCTFGRRPPPGPPRTCSAGRSQGRSDRDFSGGTEGSGGGGENLLRARGADAAPAAAALAHEPPASPAARPHRICTPGRGRAGGGASLNRLRPVPGRAGGPNPTPTQADKGVVVESVSTDLPGPARLSKAPLGPGNDWATGVGRALFLRPL